MMEKNIKILTYYVHTYTDAYLYNANFAKIGRSSVISYLSVLLRKSYFIKKYTVFP